MSYIDLVDVGKPKKYKDAKDCEFLSNKEYLSGAKKIIKKYASKYSVDLAKEMLASDDAISNVATQLMYADWRWDEKNRDNGKIALDRYRYRNQCGVWAIKVYMTRKRKFTNVDQENGMSPKIPQSLNLEIATADSNKKTDFYTTVEDKKESDNRHKEEKNDFIHEKVNELLCSGVLSEKQKTFLEEKFVNDKTMATIAKENNISRQAVAQVIDKGILKLKEFVQSKDNGISNLEELINCL